MTDFRVHFDWNGNRHIVAIAADTPDAAASIITKRYPGAIVSKTKRDKSRGVINGRKGIAYVDECAHFEKSTGQKIVDYMERLADAFDEIDVQQSQYDEWATEDLSHR